jgi:hypothetical protein
MYKVPPSIISNRRTECVEKVIADYQNGFRMHRGTIDDVHTLRQIIEKAYEYNIQRYCFWILSKHSLVFIDIKW